MKTIYFDCFSGISGDMILGALLDCGLPISFLQKEIEKLPVQGYQLISSKVQKHHLSATDLVVDIFKPSYHHRYLSDIKAIIKNSGLAEPVKEKSISVFETLARAEARIHGTTIDKIHFHEVGALDSIIDIVGGICALHLLEIEKIFASPLPLGEGLIKISHGVIPIPAPATLEILKERGVPVYSNGVQAELVTPTGAAIICTLAEKFGPPPSMNLIKVGYGSGKKDFPIPNLLRVLIGNSFSENISYEPLKLLETNIDDLNPELYNYVLEQLFQNGALDVYLTPIQMKKNRPAVKLTILAPPEKIQTLTKVLFNETSTIGIRIVNAEKIALPREVINIDTPLGSVRVKVAGKPGNYYPNFAPEYEDCYAIAQREDIPLKEVYKKVEYAIHQYICRDKADK